MQIKNHRIAFIIILFSMLFASCADEGNGDKILPGNTGRHSEIVIVADSITWAGHSAKLIKDIYQKQYPLLLKEEPFFNLIVFDKRDFSSIIKTHKNIIVFEKSDSINKIKTFNDRWAKDQFILYLQMNDDKKLAEKIAETKQELFDYFYIADLDRIGSKVVDHKLGGLYYSMQKEKGVEFIIPQDFFIVHDTTDFVWVRREKPHLTESITYFEEDYTNENQFGLESILNVRDSLYKEQVEGSVDNSYMTTERRFTPEMDTIYLNDQFTIRTRGWWKMQNDWMGGYFVRYTLPDLERRKLIHIEAFLYCPKYNKMFYLRELEAILNSFAFTKQKSKS